MTPRILPLGDTAFTVEFARHFDDAARAAVRHLDTAIAAARGTGQLPGIVDIVPTYRSLTVHHSPEADRAALETGIEALTGDSASGADDSATHWRFPVLYGGASGPDLAGLAEAAGLSETRAIDLHAGTEVEVYMLGFLPGFAFMGAVPKALRRPRRTEPRLRVPAGSVAVADRMTAIYPWESPGGWHLIGTCPLPFFDAGRPHPSLLSPGDRVSFDPVDAPRHAALQAALAAGEIGPEAFRSAP